MEQQKQQQVQRDHRLPVRQDSATPTPSGRDTRSEPVELDEDLLKQIGGGNSTDAPHGSW